MMSAVDSICFLLATISAPASGFSAPHASECSSTRSVPGGSATRWRICSTHSLRFSSSAALHVEELALAARRRESAPALPRRAAACRAGPGGRRKCSCRRAPARAPWLRRTRCSRPKSAPMVVCSFHCRRDFNLSFLVRRAPAGKSRSAPAASIPESARPIRSAPARRDRTVRRARASPPGAARRAGRDRYDRPPAAVFVNQRERRARDFIPLRRAPSVRDSLGERRLARAQIADQAAPRRARGSSPASRSPSAMVSSSEAVRYVGTLLHGVGQILQNVGGDQVLLAVRARPVRRRGRADRPRRRPPGRAARGTAPACPRSGR